MKKLIALVLAFAMLVTVFTFSASAETTAPSLVLEGAAKAAVGDTYTVAVRLNDAGNVVGGVQGELVYSGAKVVDVEVNPEVLGYNNTEDATTVAKDDGDSVNFAAVANLNAANYETRIWVIVTFEITDTASFKLEDVVFSGKDATEITGTFDSTLAPVAPATDVTLNAVGMLKEPKAVDQAIVVNAQVNATGVKEFGVLFYPTQLLDGEALTVDTDGAIKAYLTNEDAAFAEEIEGEFQATLNVNYADAAKAAKFLGIKVTTVAYYITEEGKVVYSENNSGYIQGGVASRALLNTAIDIAAEKGVEVPDNLDENIVVNRDAFLAKLFG